MTPLQLEHQKGTAGSGAEDLIETRIASVLGLKQFMQGPIRALLIKGLAGTGKTTVALEILKAAGKGKGAYVSSRVPKELLETHIPARKETLHNQEFLDIRLEDASSVLDLVMQLTEPKKFRTIVFDSWDGLHDERTYREFGLPYYKRIMDALAETGAARIFFALGASHLLDAIAEIPCEAVGVDWRTGLAGARAKLPGRTLQGNMDPAFLYADRATIAAEARRILSDGLGGAHVFNLGHGIWPTTPIDAVAHLIETVHAFKRA